MTANLNLQAMKIFVAVFELRSVGQAARSLGMSQSGMSTTLARLRRELGDALFVSTASGMQPTTRAKELVGAMREAIQLIELRILSQRRFDPAVDEREFRIALTDSAEAMYMGRVLAAVSRAAPRVRLRTVELPQLQLQRAVSEGQVDFALGYFPDLLASEFVRRKIGQHGFVCICSSANKYVLQDFSLKTYCEARHVVLEAPGRSQSLFESFIQKRGIRRNIALTTPHFTSLPEVIAATDMLASVPDALADCFADYRGLARLELPFRSPVFESHLHWSKSVHDDPASRWLRGVMVQALGVKGR
ncbi:MAG TPA: LysR family transcriptional regulator [Ramlibacter sp.]|nr:LysR family transcriptional regulator [Ramlibacter sp.]